MNTIGRAFRFPSGSTQQMVASSITAPRPSQPRTEARDGSVHEALVVTAHPLPVLRDLAKVWRELEVRADTSFFTTWRWIGGWLDTLEIGNEAGRTLRLLQVRRGATTVGLAVLGLAPRTWRSATHSTLALNQTGHAGHDSIYVEYNDILVAAECAGTVRRACFEYLAAWPGRMRLRVQAAAAPFTDALRQSSLSHRIYRKEQCDFIDLSAVVAKDGVLAVDSRNTRQQIARAFRRAEANGPLRLRRAETVAEAEQAFADLIALHSTAWQSRKGKDGAFANPFVTAFASRLAREGAADGSVDLLRVTAGAQTVGLLLNFVHRGEVYAYQSGFAYTDDNRDKPGLICHAMAAAYYKARGCRAYHFMAGAARYKASLSNAQETLTWVECYRDDAITRAEHAAEALWRRLRGAAPLPLNGVR